MKKVYCAVCLFGWAYGDTQREAMNRLANGVIGVRVWKAGHTKRFLLRVFRFEDGFLPDGWECYSPVWHNKDAEGRKYTLLRDNMGDWEEGFLPVEATISVK